MGEVHRHHRRLAITGPADERDHAFGGDHGTRVQAREAQLVEA